MTREESTIYNHKEYVTIDEFAKRVGAGRRTILRRLSEGKLQARSFDGRKTKYLEWESSKKMWDMLPHDPQKINAGRSSNSKRYGKPGTEPKKPEVITPTVGIPDLDNDVIPEIIDLSSFDKAKYRDCLNEEGEFDYDKLKTRLTAETYQQKLHKERGQLVEKTEIINWAKKLGTMVNTGLESIPQKYTSVLIAQVQSIVAQRLEKPDFEFTEKERTDLRTSLKACGPEIMRSIRLMIMEMEEE